MLEVRLAGGLALRADGAEIAPPASRRARAVLASLALQPGPHSRARLAARFWPDVLDESARTSLRVALTELRRALGPAAAYVVAGRETVALEGDGVSVDVREFEAALRRGDAVAALAACRGPILDGFEEEWALAARDDHARRLAEALEQLAARAADPAEAVALTREQVALDPLAEAPNRRLVERLAAAGDHAAALSAGRAFGERLRTSLGIAPSGETRALLERLRQEATGPIPRPPALARRHDTPFVGRRAEIERIRAAWGGVLAHRARRLVLVAGEPGVGKTRLVQEFATGALGEGVAVVMGRCSEEPLAPFEPFVEALRQADVSEALRPEDPGDAGARHRLFDAVDGALAELSARASLVLVLDDLQWADRGTLLLTSFLLRSARPGPLLVLGTYRDTELGRRSPLTGALHELRRDGALDRIVLRGLEADDVALLARSLVGADELASRVHARTGGNAFFVEEVLKGLTEPGSGEVPESVRQAVGVRLSALGDDAERLLAAAAVLGLEHDARALQATSGLGAEAAEAAVDELLRARLLRPAATAQRFEFTHALVREAVDAELNVLRRARLHRRAAEALTALGEDHYLEDVAAHRFAAASTGDARLAAELLARAGHRALDRLAYEDAAERFERALEALELAGGQDDAGPLLLARGDALLRAGDGTAARAAFTAARELAQRHGDAALLRDAALGFAGLGIAIVDLDPEAIARLDEALAAATEPSSRSRLQARLAVELYYAPDRSRSERLSADAVTAARASGDGSVLAAALNARHVALWRPDRVAERLETADAMIAAARASDDRHAELQARNWRVTDLFELGETAACRAEMAAHARLADALRLPVYQWYTPLWAAALAALAGRYGEAERRAAEAQLAGTRAGDRNADLFAGMVRFAVQLMRGDFAAMDVAFVEDKIASSPAGPAYRGSYAWILAGRGEHDRARSELEIAVTGGPAFDANWLSTQAECAEAAVLLGDPTHAEVLYARLAPYSGRPVTAGRAVTSYGAVDRHLGGLAELLGRPDDAVRHLRAAVVRNAELGCDAWREHAERRIHHLTGA